MTSEQALIDRFNRRMADLYESAKQAAPFVSVRNLPTLGPDEGFDVAQAILGARNASPAFTELLIANCDWLTVEHLVLQEPYSRLFTAEQLQVARERLAALSGHAPDGVAPPSVTPDDLAARFTDRMEAIYDRARWELNYDARHFLRLVQQRGGIEAARAILADPGVLGGLAELAAAGRPDLSVERVIIEPMFAPLFNADEVAIARRRLSQ
jgi:hypothetical protein